MFFAGITGTQSQDKGQRFLGCSGDVALCGLGNDESYRRRASDGGQKTQVGDRHSAGHDPTPERQLQQEPGMKSFAFVAAAALLCLSVGAAEISGAFLPQKLDLVHRSGFCVKTLP